MVNVVPTDVQLHVADKDSNYVFVHPETSFHQVIDSKSGKSLKEFIEGGLITSRTSRLHRFTQKAIVDSQKTFIVDINSFDATDSELLVFLNGEFLYENQEYTYTLTSNSLKLNITQNVRANDTLHVIFIIESVIAGNINNGSPTPEELTNGIIVDSGNNANGYYTKFANGLLICEYKMDFNYNEVGGFLSSTWTFPHEFTFKQEIGFVNLFINRKSCTVDFTEDFKCSLSYIGDKAPIAATVRVKDTVKQYNTLSLLAIGRWK